MSSTDAIFCSAAAYGFVADAKFGIRLWGWRFEDLSKKLSLLSFYNQGPCAGGKEGMSQGLKPILRLPLMSGLKPGPILETKQSAHGFLRYTV